MILTGVELRNVKSYKRETIEFKEGINGISGENGHGKTTILEAVGFALFDFLPYKEKEFLRHGEKSGEVAVRVIADDGLKYRISRRIGGNDYHVRTPVREVQGKKDVQDWILGTLFPGVKDSKELSSIFENAIGVPQGTFTTVFSFTPKPRKDVFDRILKVDEYRIAFENLLSCINAIADQINSMDRELLQLKTRTEGYDQLRNQRQEVTKTLEELQGLLDKSKVRLDELRTKRDLLSERKKLLEELRGEIEKLEIRIEGLGQRLGESQENIKKAREACFILEENRGRKEEYERAKEEKKKYDGMRSEHDGLREIIFGLEKEISSLAEKKVRVSCLEGEIEELEEKLAEISEPVQKQLGLEEKIKISGEARAVAQKELRDIEERMRMVGKENLCPIIKGVTCRSVEDFQSYFEEQSGIARNKLARLEESLAMLNKELEDLGDPKGRLAGINSLIEDKKSEIGRLSKDIEIIQRKETELKEMRLKYAQYEGIDELITNLEEKMEALFRSYTLYIQNKPFADKISDFIFEYESLEKSLIEAKKTRETLHQKYEAETSGFDEKELRKIEAEYEELGKTVRGIEHTFKEKTSYLEDLTKRIIGIDRIFDKIRVLEDRLAYEGRFQSYAKFIRETLRDSAQNIVLEFIAGISSEANNIYCEIMDDFAQELRWTEDYEVIVTEGGEEKSFNLLSGGERMSAALAVRLALLKALSDCDIVFLDEPTQNMDEARRENLSEQIMKIKGFKQIFVISHDDTFNEKYGHAIRVQKINGESRVVD